MKAALRERLRRRAFRRALEHLAPLPPGVVPDRGMIAELRAAWGNVGYSADVSFIEETLARVLASSGPIVECGSGLTTILIAAVGGRVGKRLNALEHQADWHRRVTADLAAYGLEGAEVRLASLRTFGDYDWYDVAPSTLPAGISLVVCDGPPEGVRGGRYGVLPVLRSRLAPGATLLLDDANTDVGHRTLATWKADLGVAVRVEHCLDGDYAIVQCSQPSAPPGTYFAS